MELLEGLLTRQSVRHFSQDPVDPGTIRKILEAALWAPSGLNNQPWKFVVVRDAGIRKKLAGLTKYSRIIEEAPVCLGVFLDKSLVYHEIKDHQAMGACLQNILLAIHGLGLGGVWLGEILKNAEKVKTLLKVPGNHDLMAVVAMGHIGHLQERKVRKSLEEAVLHEI